MTETQEPKYNAAVCDDGETRLVNRTTLRTIPDYEPTFVLRARDIHAIPALAYYASAVRDPHHRQVIYSRIRDFAAFAVDHGDEMKEPDTDKSFPL